MNAMVSTCAFSLLEPGVCCAPECTSPARVAILDKSLIEHAVCEGHLPVDVLGAKPLVWDPLWGPQP